MAKLLIVPEPLKIGYEEIVVGDPGPGQLCVRMVLSGVSHGTEMRAYLGDSPFLTKKFQDRVFQPIESTDSPFYPYRYMGYDAVGVVASVGDGVTRYAVGDRVWCQSFHQTECLMNEDSADIHLLAPQVTDDEAILLNLCTITLNAIYDAEIKLGGAVVIVGGGAIGQLAVQMAFLSGARKVFLVEPSAERRVLAATRTAVIPIAPQDGIPALQITRQNQGRQPDVVLECSGAVAGVKTAIQAAGIAGTVVAAGFSAGPATALDLSEEFHHNRITLKASMAVWGCPSYHGHLWPRERTLAEALALMEAKKLKLDGFVSASFPFHEAQQAYEAIHRDPGKYLKVALTY